jgi:formylglycine-generating enzyme required for sulfatase activity
LGIIWFQLQTGRLALMSMPTDWRDDVVAAKMPGPLLDLLASCIGKQERRPKDAGALVQRLTKALGGDGENTTVPPPVEPVPVPRPPRVVEPVPDKSPRSSLSLGFTLFGLVAFLAVFLVCAGVVALNNKDWFSPSIKINPTTETSTNVSPSTKKNKETITNNFNYQEGPLGMKFVKVPKGTFWMSKYNNNAQEQVTIAQDFELAAHTVTQGQWQELMGDNPSYFSRSGGGQDKVQNIADADLKLFPVESVSWNRVQEFLKKLNAREKGRGRLYRLPSSAEWEYACRGAATSKEECSFDFYVGNKPTNDLSAGDANFSCEAPGGNGKKGTPLNRTTKVGSYAPNKLGLYDMHGNVWQWCSDLYEGTGGARVVRGGDYNSFGAGCAAWVQASDEPVNTGDIVGIRLVAVPSGG